MVPADNFAALRRTVALLEADRPLPPEVRGWLAGALARIVAGEDAADVFGTSRAARLALRDDRLRDLAALADGGVTSKARAVSAWLHEEAEAPPAALPIIAELSGRPGWRQILRVLRGSRSGDTVPETTRFDTAAPDAAIAAWFKRGPVRKVSR